MSDSRIKKLCENVYLVCGKLIGFDAPGMFDMEDPGIRKDFIAFADDLYTEESEIPDRRYGDETICIFAGLSVRIATEGLDARMTEEEVRTLADVLEHAGEFTRTQVAEGPCLEVAELDREIMAKMPLSEDELRKLSEELAREDATDHARAPVQDHKVIDIADWRKSHA